MANDNEDTNKKDADTFKFPLSLKDIISMVTVAVTLTLAWGVFGTRLTVLEKEVVNINSSIKDQKEVSKQQEIRTAALESRIRDVESTLEDMWKANNRRGR